MKRCLILMAFLVSGTLWAGSPPESINYQGKLSDNNGPVNANVPVIISVFAGPAAPSPVYEYSQVTSVKNGVFNIVFGSTPYNGKTLKQALLTLASTDSPEMAVTVNGNLLSPRQPLVAAPYALVANQVTDGSVSNNQIAANADIESSKIKGGSFAPGADFSFPIGSVVTVNSSLQAKGGINLNNQQITNLAAPTADADAANRKWVADSTSSIKVATIDVYKGPPACGHILTTNNSCVTIGSRNDSNQVRYFACTQDPQNWIATGSNTNEPNLSSAELCPTTLLGKITPP